MIAVERARAPQKPKTLMNYDRRNEAERYLKRIWRARVFINFDDRRSALIKIHADISLSVGTWVSLLGAD